VCLCGCPVSCACPVAGDRHAGSSSCTTQPGVRVATGQTRCRRAHEGLLRGEPSPANAGDAGAIPPQQRLGAAAAGSGEGVAHGLAQQLLLLVASDAGQMAGSQDASARAAAAVLFCAVQTHAENGTSTGPRDWGTSCWAGSGSRAPGRGRCHFTDARAHQLAKLPASDGLRRIHHGGIQVHGDTSGRGSLPWRREGSARRAVRSGSSHYAHATPS
jgi:hypothetical protein